MPAARENLVHQMFFDGDDEDKRRIIGQIVSNEIGPNEVNKATLIEIMRWMREDSLMEVRPTLLTLRDIEQDYLPSVIWVEKREDALTFAGVWVGDRYEIDNGDVMDDITREVEERGGYNTEWRVWVHAEPTRKQMDETPWEEAPAKRNGLYDDPLDEGEYDD